MLCTILQLAVPGMVLRDLWCWVDPMSNGLYEWLPFYGPIMILLSAVALFWIIAIVKVSQHIKLFKTKAYMVQSMAGVLVFFVCYVMMASHRVYNVYVDHNFTYELLHVISLGSLGTLAFFVFGLTHQTVRGVVGLFNRGKKKK